MDAENVWELCFIWQQQRERSYFIVGSRICYWHLLHLKENNFSDGILLTPLQCCQRFDPPHSYSLLATYILLCGFGSISAKCNSLVCVRNCHPIHGTLSWTCITTRDRFEFLILAVSTPAHLTSLLPCAELLWADIFSSNILISLCYFISVFKCYTLSSNQGFNW